MTQTFSLTRSTSRALLPAVLVVGCGASAAQAAPFNPPPGSPTRVERINGGNAMTVASHKGTVGLRSSFAAPAGVATASVRVERNGHKLYDRDIAFTVAGTTATLSTPINAHKAGTYRVGVRVNGSLVGKVVEFDVLPSHVNSGSGGASVKLMQSVLADQKYVVGKSGSFDGRTQRALVAARKRLGLSRTATFDRKLATKLAKGQGTWSVRYPDHGRHIEANLSLQLIALIGNHGNTERIYTTSSGKPSTPTILGNFSVYRKDWGTNAKGMVDSSYFIRGYAIHGYAEVPTYNASHGCLRVPVPDAASIYNWVQFGTKVDVYR
jgi:hypothetical protein